MDLHRTLLKDVILPKVKSLFVIDYYEGIRSLLNSRSDFPYKDIFANPRVRTKNEIIWSTDAFKEHPKLLDDLKGEEADYYSYLLYKEIGAVVRLTELLKEEEGGAPLSELLSKAISNIDEKSVYCGEDKIVLVNWGIIPRQGTFEGGGIYRSGGFVGGWDRVHNFNPRAEQEEIKAGNQESTEEKPHEEKPKEDGLPNPFIDSENFTPEIEDDNLNSDSSDSDDVNKRDENTSLGNKSEETLEGASSDDSSKKEEEKGDGDSKNEDKEKGDGLTGKGDDIDDGNDNGKGDDSKKTDEEKNGDKSEKDEESKKGDKIKEDEEKDKSGKIKKDEAKSRKYGWDDFFAGSGRGLSFLMSRLWWILLIIAVIVIGLFLGRDYQGPINQINPFFRPLPETPEIMPIASDDVVDSEDGDVLIAGDRLNILLEKKNENTMLEWAKAFKKAYPGADYAVKYYNKDLYLLQIKVPKAERATVMKELKSKLKDFDFDVYEEPVYQVQEVPNDPALKNRDESWYIDDINAKEAWEISQGSEDIIIAVIDNGFDLNHPEFEGKIVSPYNALTRNSNVRPIKAEGQLGAHGTHVAGLAAANANNGLGISGIAPNCKLMPIQAAHDNPKGYLVSTAILEGVLYAIKNGADVINLSLGKSPTAQYKRKSEAEQLNYISNTGKYEEALWKRIFQKAEENNCTIVFSAGNDNIISGFDPRKRSENIFLVSATDINDEKVGFSNYGRYPDLKRYYSTVSAPGKSIYSSYPNASFGYKDGTSMSAPIVAGAVALLKSVNPTLRTKELIDILQKTGREVDPRIGPIINLGAAMRVATGKSGNLPPAMDCEKIKNEIMRLQAQLDSLKGMCPSVTIEPDTLKYDDVIKNPLILDGLWKSTTSLFNTTDNSPIELYMSFENMKGQLLIKNKGVDFTAPLTASINNDEIHITQGGPAVNASSSNSFVPYVYNCEPDRKRNLFCDAVSATNRVSFNLVRIR